MKNFFLLLCMNLFLLSMHSQGFKGKVVDAETNKPVSSTEIFIEEMHEELLSNDSGVFMLQNLPNKVVEIEISRMGYERKYFSINLYKQKNFVFKLNPSHIHLHEVIVSSPRGTLHKENILDISRKKMSELNQLSPLSMAEAISTIPGVEQKSTGTGIGKPVIRGLSGNRIVVYAQNIRIENQQWGDEHGLGVGDIGIGSVEVVKGPASLLYGSDALGGVLYFVDERFAKHNYFEGYIRSVFHSNALGSQNSLALKYHKNKLKVNVFGAVNSFADYKIPNNKRVYNSRFGLQNIKTNIGYSKKNWISTLSYSFLQNDFGIISEDSLYSDGKDRTYVLPNQTILNHSVGFKNTILLKKSKLNLVLGFTSNRRKEFEDTSIAALDMDLQTFTTNFKWNLPKFKKINMIVGVQTMHKLNKNYGEELLVPDAFTNDAGLFSVVNYEIKKVELQAGLRMDYRAIKSEEKVENGSILFPKLNKTYSSLNYSIGAVYAVNKLKFRTNLSSGFRAPNTSELLSNGVHEGTNQYIIGNKNLKSEFANQFDLSMDYKNEHLTFSVNGFYNYIQHYIFLSPSSMVISGSPAYNYKQVNANLYGGEMGFHYHPHLLHWLHLSSSFSTVLAEDDNGFNLPFIPSNKINSTAKVEFKKKKKVFIHSVFLNHIYKMAQNRFNVFETYTPNYQLLNLGVNIKVSSEKYPLYVKMGVKNMLNTQYVDHLSRLKPLGIPNQGINFFVSLKVKFKKKI